MSSSSSTAPAVKPASTGAKKGTFFPHIEGVRAVAVLLVVIYHLFTDRAAGAVDVFFILTGFLVVSSLMRRVDRGMAGIREFLSGLFLRLAPVSLVVLAATAIGSLLFIPAVNLFLSSRQIIASAFYVQNWQLIVQGADYLDRQEPPSPVLHFWAMSVQMQFYLATALIFAILIGLIALRQRTISVPRFLVTLFGVIFVLSFVYSVYTTHFVNPDAAYFDTVARAWEFAMGALLALALARWPELSLHWFWGWVGLALVLAAGPFVSATLPFPGFAALAPTVGTVLMVLGARNRGPGSANFFLASPVMVSLGGIAYTLYLVHWPILIFYRRTVSEDVGLLVGIAMIGLSIALSYLLRFAVEKPLLRRKYGERSGRLLAITTIPLLVVTVAIPGWWIARVNAHVTGDRVALGYDTALIDQQGPVKWYPESVDPTSVVPDFELVRYANPPSYTDVSASGVTCHIFREDRGDGTWCEYGETDSPSFTIAMVGASHVAQWLPALDYLGKERGWRIMSKTAADCRFASNNENAREEDGCTALAERMLDGVLEMRPDAVFTVANYGPNPTPDPGRIEYWQQLDTAGIPVIAVRDNPWFEEHPSGCLNRYLDDPLHCATPTREVLAETFTLDGAPDNVALIDMTDQYCDSDYCPPLIGNILVWRDYNHFTSQFVLTMTRELEAAIDDVWTPGAWSQVDPEAIERLLAPR